MIFFNGRRPAEVTNLKVFQWTMAKEHFYLTEAQKRMLEKENILMENIDKIFRVIITIGKSKDVSVVIPVILYEAFDFLCDPEIRKMCKIHEQNDYIFPSSKQSLDPSYGFDNLRQCLLPLDLDETAVSSVKVIIDNFYIKY